MGWQQGRMFLRMWGGIRLALLIHMDLHRKFQIQTVLYQVVHGHQTPRITLEVSMAQNHPMVGDDHSASMFLRLVKVGHLAAKVIGRHNNRVRGGVNGTTQMEIQLLQTKRTLEAQGRQLHQ